MIESSATENSTGKYTSWLDTNLFSFLPRLNLETILVVIIIVLTVISRFYHVDLRVMSHDEVNHVVPSWDLFQGRTYRHDPVTHGPLQFHLLALSFFLLGDNDFSARVPAVLFSIATVIFVLFAYRRYLGRTGALLGGLFFMISPYLLFYGRYTRNEAFVALFGVITIYAVLRHLDKGGNNSLYLLTAATALQFVTKETSFIYTAQLLIFLGLVFLVDVFRARWNDDLNKNIFRILILVMVLAVALAGVLVAIDKGDTLPVVETPQAETGGDAATSATTPGKAIPPLSLAAGGIGILCGLVALGFAFRDQGADGLRSLRSFTMMILVLTMVLPQLCAFPLSILGFNPLDYSNTGMVPTAIAIVICFIVAAAIGLWWNWRLWIVNAAIFYGIFVVFYTTFFTNGQGFFTGLVGSLGYWISQQGVQRGSQPLYYYALIQIPIYEYLALAGTLLATYFGIRYGRFSSVAGISPSAEQPDEGTLSTHDRKGKGTFTVINTQRIPTLALLLFWVITSLGAYSVAGEKMPWLTVHIALPMLLTAGWGCGFLVDKIPWRRLFDRRGLIVLLVLPVFVTSLAAVVGMLLGNNLPFQGKELVQLETTSTFVMALIALVASAAGIVYLLWGWKIGDVLYLITATILAILVVLTTRTAAMASYVNYDYATEYLVYAHAAPGPKQVLAQVEEISRRTTKGLDVVVAYDNDALYPYWWYLRNYPNHRWYTDKPTRDLRDAAMIIAGESTSGKMAPIVKDNFIDLEYMRLWWPNQDYFNLDWPRLQNALFNPEMRAAIFDIWLNRDYRAYARLTENTTLTPETWQPSSRMHFYIRKDIVAQIWDYGTAPVLPVVAETDPYAGKIITLTPDKILGSTGSADGQLQAPRGVATGPDGSIYVADSRNHRIERFSADGAFMMTWGIFADVSQGSAPGGTFNEPWGIAVAKDGSVFVTDTWNHRIQKFSADGKFIKMWGNFAQDGGPDSFWGPRGLAIDSQNRLYVTDTGNKRVVVFTLDGEYVTQFGTAGMELGQFDEPVGLAVDRLGQVYVADTWNQRIQVFSPAEDGIAFTATRSWEVNAWNGQSLDNKPFLAVDSTGNVFINDPEGYRILEFDSNGAFIRGWGDYSDQSDGFGMPSSVNIDSMGGVWVSDAVNNTVLHFTLP